MSEPARMGGAVRVECPGCGTVRVFETFHRTAGEFCRVCDYPLFWAPHAVERARTVLTVTGVEVMIQGALRTRPDVPSRAEPIVEPCRACEELNPIGATYCLRCGVELHPAPEPEPVVEEPPAPPPAPPPPAPWWSMLTVRHVVIGLAIVAALQLIVLLAR